MLTVGRGCQLKGLPVSLQVTVLAQCGHGNQWGTPQDFCAIETRRRLASRRHGPKGRPCSSLQQCFQPQFLAVESTGVRIFRAINHSDFGVRIRLVSLIDCTHALEANDDHIDFLPGPSSFGQPLFGVWKPGNRGRSVGDPIARLGNSPPTLFYSAYLADQVWRVFPKKSHGDTANEAKLVPARRLCAPRGIFTKRYIKQPMH